MTTITNIQKRIVKAFEAGTDTAPLLKELRDVRAKKADEIELEQLQKVAEERQALKAKAQALVAKVEAQEKGIDKFLSARDVLLDKIKPLLPEINELSKMAAPGWERQPGIVYSSFNDAGQFVASVRAIPKDYLPENFHCSFLQMKSGVEKVEGKANEAAQYFMACIGLLDQLVKGEVQATSQDAEGLLANDPETEKASCIVCAHPDVAIINGLLMEGTKTMRELEVEYKVSRSSLSKHKNNCKISELVEL